MSLNLLNNIFGSLRENKFVQSFINELTKCLENNSNNLTNEIPIIEDILSKNKLTTGNKKAIKWNLDDAVLRYAEQKFSNSTIYFVKDNKKTYWKNNEKHYDSNLYTILKAENNKIEEIEINKKDLPKNIGVNDVFKIEKGEYVVDKSATQELQKEIINMAEETINKQNLVLNKHRKEGHLYLVSEEVGNNRFLRDLTENSTIEFEEVNIPQNVLEKATEGAVLKFINGEYEYYSNDGFEPR